jgi:hypothetical protein
MLLVLVRTYLTEYILGCPSRVPGLRRIWSWKKQRKLERCTCLAVTFSAPFILHCVNNITSLLGLHEGAESTPYFAYRLATRSMLHPCTSQNSSWAGLKTGAWGGEKMRILSLTNLQRMLRDLQCRAGGRIENEAKPPLQDQECSA